MERRSTYEEIHCLQSNINALKCKKLLNLFNLIYCWASKMKTRWLPLQVQSSCTVLSFNTSFLKEQFHHNFTREHNNSLLSIIGYTSSIQCRLSSLPLTTVLPACAAPGLGWNGHSKRKVDTRCQIPCLKSYSTGSLTQTHWEQTVLLWHKLKLKLATVRFSVTPSLSLRSSQHWRGDQNVSPMVSAFQARESSWH